MGKDPNWCTQCEGNGYFCKDGKTTNCKDCSGLGIKKSKSIKEKDGKNKKKNGFSVETSFSTKSEVNAESVEQSLGKVPLPPEEKPRMDSRFKKKFSMRNDVKNVSVYKEYKSKLEIVMDNLHMLTVAIDRLKKISVTMARELRDRYKHNTQSNNSIKDINFNSRSYSTINCFIDFLDNNNISDQEIVLMLKNTETFALTTDVFISECKTAYKKLKKDEENTTKVLEGKILEAEKLRKKCNDLVTKLSNIVRSSVSATNGRKLDFFFKFKKKDPEATNKKLSSLRESAHRHTTIYERNLEHLNEDMNSYFEVYIREKCEKLDDLDIDVNRKLEEALCEEYELLKKQTESRQFLKKKYNKCIQKVQVLNDTPDCSAKIHKEHGNLSREEYQIEYDLSLRPKDILDNT